MTTVWCGVGGSSTKFSRECSIFRLAPPPSPPNKIGGKTFRISSLLLQRAIFSFVLYAPACTCLTPRGAFPFRAVLAYLLYVRVPSESGCMAVCVCGGAYFAS